MFKKVKGKLVAVATGASLAVFSGASFASSGVDTTEILAAIQDAETKGVAIAIAVTVCLFLFAGVKLLRRAK